MTIINEIYASAPFGEEIVLTLTISHSGDAFQGLAISDGDRAIRLARSYRDLTAVEESGEYKTYMAAPIAIQRPERNVQGRQNLSFQIDNVSGEALAALQAAQESGGIVTVTVRVYRWNALSSGPAEAPISMRMVGARVTRQSARIDCAFGDLANVNWNRTKYTATLAPGLRYW